jgi:glycosyltransferase involved in cell wall biosynthesis|tara:strand:- start:9264 stop:10097 length:834 start_codon:yes stop_codon:yes gene_type:complete
MTGTPLISIIIPSYNQGNYIGKCLQSIIDQEQTFLNYEVIIQDNNSTDNTKLILEKYQNKKNFLIYHEKDEGQADGINKGIKKAKGQWVTWQNCDDYYLSNNAFSEIFNEIELDKNKEYGLFYGNMKLVNQRNNLQKELRFYGANSYTLAIEGMVLSNQSCFWKKSLHTKHGYLRKFRVNFDYEWFLRISQFTKFKKINYKKPLSVFLLYDKQKSNNYSQHEILLRSRIVKIYLKKFNIPSNYLVLKILLIISKFFRFLILILNGDFLYLIRKTIYK